jgi:glycosyltransferase involved in cell wall biosynthesis
VRVAHLTTVDSSLRFLLLPQLLGVAQAGGEVIGISAPGPWVADLEQRGVRHVALPASTRGRRPSADVRAAWQLWRILRRERPDVLHTHNPKPGVYGRIVARFARVPMVVNTVHGLYATDDDPLPKRAAVYLLEAVAARFSDAELVQNPEDLALIERHRIAPPGRASLLGNGVDLDRFDRERVGEPVRRAQRSALGIGEGDVLIGTVGRLVAEKGYPELFAAVSRLGPHFHLVAIGPEDPEKEDALPRRMLDDARAAGVHILGWRDDLESLYAAMDVFVLASHREGLPRSAMEAAAMALPVVATDIRGCRQVVEDGETGLLVPVRDPEALRAALERVGEDGRLRARMGEAGRRRAEERFDERAVVRTVMDTYRRLAREKGHPAFAASEAS